MSVFLQEDRELLAKHLPGLEEQLAAAGLHDLERPSSPAIEWFREAGGPSLFVPSDLGGQGVGLAAGVRLQRALASRAPSLGVATTMHHFSVASMLDLEDAGSGVEWMLAEAVARNSLLIASGAGEGTGGGQLVRPQMTARATEDGLLLSGVKKPCSLSGSMDLLFATVRVVEPEGEDQLALAVVPKNSPGLSVRPFWTTPVLAGAQSEEVVLEDVFVPTRAVSELGPIGTTTDSLRAALVWFELLIAATYLGICGALLERALSSRRAPTALGDVIADLEGATYALEALGMKVDAAGRASQLVGPALIVRYGAERAVTRACTTALEALGGGAFVTSPDVAYLHSASCCLMFHPPARHAAAESIIDSMRGEQVNIDSKRP
jgi:alkylation response protein AidB-like acyl-CoA dehydrogenase